jgi:hypothetical protein
VIRLMPSMSAASWVPLERVTQTQQSCANRANAEKGDRRIDGTPPRSLVSLAVGRTGLVMSLERQRGNAARRRHLALTGIAPARCVTLDLDDAYRVGG